LIAAGQKAALRRFRPLTPALLAFGAAWNLLLVEAPPSSGGSSMMLTKLSKTVTLALPLCVLACASDHPARSASGYEPAMTPAARSAPSAPGALGSESSERLADPQITTILRAINVAEVDQARMAVGKVHEQTVKRFAETMIAHHGQALKDIDALNTHLGFEGADSQLVQELRIKATNVEQTLSDINDSTFDKRYMLAQIDMHRAALDAIDSRLTPAAVRDDVKQLIASMRPRVADHLQMAQTIVSMLK
jgi:putative membrane protein